MAKKLAVVITPSNIREKSHFIVTVRRQPAGFEMQLRDELFDAAQ